MATLSDLDALLALERSSFALERQEGAASLARSIVSPHQEVWLLRLEGGGATQGATASSARRASAEGLTTAAASAVVSTPAVVADPTIAAVAIATTPVIAVAPAVVAASVLRLFAKTLRIYSIAVAIPARGRGYGQLLLEHAILRARALGRAGVSLEADAANAALLRWYGHNGFEVVRHLPDYYGRKQHGVRMRLRL